MWQQKIKLLKRQVHHLWRAPSYNLSRELIFKNLCSFSGCLSRHSNDHSLLRVQEPLLCSDEENLPRRSPRTVKILLSRKDQVIKFQCFPNRMLHWTMFSLLIWTFLFYLTYPYLKISTMLAIIWYLQHHFRNMISRLS